VEALFWACQPDPSASPAADSLVRRDICGTDGCSNGQRMCGLTEKVKVD
jgi:hypothetical protein